MFDMFKGMGQLAGLMKNLPKIQEEMAQMQERLAGDFESGFGLGLDDLVNAQLLQFSQLVHAFNAGHDVQLGTDPAHAGDDGVGDADGGNGDQTEPALGEARRLQDELLSGVAVDDRVTGLFGALHAPLV